MKKKKYLAAVLISIAIYITGIIFGILLICLFPQYLSRKNNDLYTKEKIAEYRLTGKVVNWSHNGVAVIIYDDKPSFYRFFGQGNNMFTMQYYDQTCKAAEQVLKGKNTYNFYFLVKDYSAIGYCSRLINGRRIEINGQPYAFFWVKEMTELPEITIGFILSFTIISIFSFIIVLLSLRRRDKYAELQKKYIDNITHELKTPVASVKAITEALSDGLASDEAQRNTYYGMILSETNQQQKMIQEALLLSRLQSSVYKKKLARIKAGDLFNKIYDKYEMLFDLAGLNFDILSSAYDLPDVYADLDDLIKVISTLLDNTIKYVPEGGSVTISGKAAGRRAIICIEDTGKGIPTEALPYIFERFYRVSRDDAKQGSGLGLAIAKELTEAMKGTIRAESTPGKGTKMFIRLRTC